MTPVAPYFRLTVALKMETEMGGEKLGDLLADIL
jgi:hypothetical protein